MSLNWFDYTIIGVILLSIVISFFRGFLRETISLITWVSGLVLALRFSPVCASWLHSIIETPFLQYVVAFAIIFILTFILGLFLSALVKRGVDATGLSFADRILGGIFGAARGVALVAIVLMFMTMTTFSKMTLMTDSELTPWFMPMVTWLDSFLPEQMNSFQKWTAIDGDDEQVNLPVQHPESAST